MRGSWEDIRARLRAHGLELPEYQADGLLYVPNPDFSVLRGKSLGRGSEWLMTLVLDELLDPPPADLPTTADILARLDLLIHAAVEDPSAPADSLDPPTS